MSLQALALCCVQAICLLVVGGCACTDECVDTALKRTEARLAYGEACNCSPPCGMGDDYERGWRAGYLDVSEGRSGTPPIVAPHRYRTYKYQTGSGKQAAAAWYQGFSAGAAAAKCQGLDQANRVFSVESPCMSCEGPCECSAPGVLPTAEAMLRRQQYRHGGQVIVEYPLGAGEVIAPGYAPAPVEAAPPTAPAIIAPEQVEAPPVESPTPEKSSQSPADAVGPELKTAAIPPATVPKPVRTKRNREIQETETLLAREIAPPVPVELPSNLTHLEEVASSSKVVSPKPNLVSPAESPIVSKAPTPKAVSPPAPIRQSPPPVMEAQPAALAPIAGVRAAPAAERAVPLPAVKPQPASRKARSPQIANSESATPPQVKSADQPEFEVAKQDSSSSAAVADVTAPLSQPNGVTVGRMARRGQAENLLSAPQPTVQVRETPAAEVKDFSEPPKAFPLAAVAPPTNSTPPQPELDVPDSIGFPSRVIPPVDTPLAAPKTFTPHTAQPAKPNRYAPRATIPAGPVAKEVTNGWDLERLDSFTRVGKKEPKEPTTLSQPESPPSASPESAGPEPIKVPQEAKRPKPLLPLKLVDTPSEISLPSSIAKTYETSSPAKSNEVEMEVSQVVSQPKTLLSTPALLQPSSLGDQVISFSLEEHGLEQTAIPMQLSQPELFKPAEQTAPLTGDEIRFPTNVWPASYRLNSPPTR